MPKTYTLMNLVVNLPIMCQGEPVCRDLTDEQVADLNAWVKDIMPAWEYVLVPDDFPISFDVVNADGHLLSRHSVRNGEEENNVMVVIRRGCPGAVQVNRRVV